MKWMSGFLGILTLALSTMVQAQVITVHDCATANGSTVHMEVYTPEQRIQSLIVNGREFVNTPVMSYTKTPSYGASDFLITLKEFMSSGRDLILFIKSSPVGHFYIEGKNDYYAAKNPLKCSSTMRGSVLPSQNSNLENRPSSF